MSLTNTNSLLAFRRNFPVTENLHFLFDASDPLNTIVDDEMTVGFDLSGNGRHATSTGVPFEATGMNGQPTLHNEALGDPLNIDDGADTYSTSRFSVFAVTRGTLQVHLFSGASTALSIIASWWTAFNNSPFGRNDVPATVIQAATFGTDYGDDVARDFTFCYEDSGNIRDWYTNGVLEATNSSGWSGGVAAGSFDIWHVGGAITTARIALLAVYENKILTQAEASALHFYAKAVKGLIP